MEVRPFSFRIRPFSFESQQNSQRKEICRRIQDAEKQKTGQKYICKTGQSR